MVNCDAKSIDSPVASRAVQGGPKERSRIATRTSIAARGSNIASGRAAAADLGPAQHGLPNF
jgi:hypothetical protein